MHYAVEMGSGAIIYIQNVINTFHAFKKLWREYIQKHTDRK
jgi:hypothetical protein